MISTTTSSSSSVPCSTPLVHSFAAAVSPYLILPEIKVCPTVISYLIVHFTEFLITVYLTSHGTLSAQRYPNSLDACRVRKPATTYRHTYMEWRVLVARHQTLVYQFTPPAPAKTGLTRLPVEWLSAYGNDGDLPKSPPDVPIWGLGEVQTNVKRKRHTTSKVVSTGVASVM